ncbi:DgyrCDS8816 [Dimorphilus gyrociliatus]|uniref:DgyrCDS8816 n=1 Tax=Dimorphilus gyrociliatus TaxID=2664684 RepID=A0A7I8VX03_9ANNE|nr:DgyrCDS8816 [Dimorphilus gyrociliatus]
MNISFRMLRFIPIHHFLGQIPFVFLAITILATRTGSAKQPRPHLRVTTILNHPYVMLKHGSTDEYIGFIPDLLSKLADRMMLDYTLKVAPDSKYGVRNRLTGNWDGMIGQVYRNEADVAASSIFYTKQRDNYVDFTIPFLNVSASIIYKKSEYAQKIRITKASDLLNQDFYKFGTLSRGPIKIAFKRTNNSVYRDLWRKMDRFYPHVFYATNDDALQRVRSDPRYAFILPKPIADYIVGRKPCELLQADSFLLNQRYCLVLKENSTYLWRFNYHLKELTKNGFLASMYRKWWINSAECSHHTAGGSSSFSAEVGNGTGVSKCSLYFRKVFIILILHLFTFHIHI